MASKKHEASDAAAPSTRGSPGALPLRSSALAEVGRGGMGMGWITLSLVLMACGADDGPPDGIDVAAQHTRSCIQACELRSTEIVSLTLRSDAARVVQVELHDWATNGRMLRQRSDPEQQEVELEPERARTVNFSGRTDGCGTGDELPFAALVAMDGVSFEVEGVSFFYQDVEPCSED